MVASVAGLPVMAVYCKVQLLSQSAYSTMAMTEVVECISGLRMPVIEGVLLEKEHQVEPRCMVKVGEP